MKKSIFSILVLSAMTLCSCMSEEEMFQPLDNSLATIELNISNNEELNVSTRATVNSGELSNWHASATNSESTPVPGISKASDLLNKTFTLGTYSFTVSSHETLEAALANETSAGAPYYEASLINQNLVKGVNTLTFECGTAKNSKITVDWSGANGVQGLTFTNVTATQDSRTYTYTECGTEAKSAFFEAGADKAVRCTLNYTFSGTTKTINKTINTTTAATNYKLTIKANSNGTITTITINYDDGFTEGTTESVTIDAATGSEVSNS